MIRGFAVGLIIGVMVGTYSSIYLTSNMLMVLGISKEDLALPINEGKYPQSVTGRKSVSAAGAWPLRSMLSLPLP